MNRAARVPGAHRIGVCSWSLQPETPAELARLARATGVEGVQLALGPLRKNPKVWGARATAAALGEQGLALFSGMLSTAGEDYSSLAAIARTGGVRPDEHWPANLAAAQADARLAGELGLGLVSFHAGFLPEKRDDPERAKMLERLRIVIDVFADQGVRLAFETGQETAETLAGVLAELDRPTVGVNFDPANILLYDKGSPVQALALLGPRVLQVHVKDAKRTRTPGTWGEEVVVGTGEVDWTAFFDVLQASGSTAGRTVDLCIEREAGDHRVEDVRTARELVERELARIGRELARIERELGRHEGPR